MPPTIVITPVTKDRLSSLMNIEYPLDGMLIWEIMVDHTKMMGQFKQSHGLILANEFHTITPTKILQCVMCMYFLLINMQKTKSEL